MFNLIHEIQKTTEYTKHRKLKCRCGIHTYKWSWRHLCKVCIFCGKKKQLKG